LFFTAEGRRKNGEDRRGMLGNGKMGGSLPRFYREGYEAETRRARRWGVSGVERWRKKSTTEGRRDEVWEGERRRGLILNTKGAKREGVFRERGREQDSEASGFASDLDLQANREGCAMSGSRSAVGSNTREGFKRTIESPANFSPVDVSRAAPGRMPLHARPARGEGWNGCAESPARENWGDLHGKSGLPGRGEKTGSVMTQVKKTPASKKSGDTLPHDRGHRGSRQNGLLEGEKKLGSKA
jgi:hypothetical protein